MGRRSGGDKDKVQDTAKNNNPPELGTLPAGTKTKSRAGPACHPSASGGGDAPASRHCSGSRDWLPPAWFCRFLKPQ